jgi:hypothetical protein
VFIDVATLQKERKKKRKKNICILNITKSSKIQLKQCSSKSAGLYQIDKPFPIGRHSEANDMNPVSSSSTISL